MNSPTNSPTNSSALRFIPSLCAVNKRDLADVHVETVYLGMFEQGTRSFGGFQIWLSDGSKESYEMINQTVTDQFVFYFDVANLPERTARSVFAVGVDPDAMPLTIEGVSTSGHAFDATVERKAPAGSPCASF
jgi:hypothetical protein